VIMVTKLKVEIENHEDWDFAKTDTKYMTHGIHPYPAKMIPQISKRLIERYGTKKGLVLDPFTGSGGVLVEARLAQLNSVGIDVNPLACLLSEVKANPVDPNILENSWKKLDANIQNDIQNNTNYDLPKALYKVKLDYWFKEQTTKDLVTIRNNIQRIENVPIRKFFSICLSSTVRKVSGTRGREFKLYRIKPEEWEKYNPDTLMEFKSQTTKYIEKMREYYQKAPHKLFSKTFIADNRTIHTDEFPEEGNIILSNTPPKLVVTSPPYGDSQTTVAYGQFSRYPALWINYEQGFENEVIMKVDKLGLGGFKNRNVIHDFPALSKTLDAISEKDTERSMDANSFFSDLYQSLEVMYNVVDNESTSCIVVANRTMRRIRIPTHLIIMEMAVDIGFENKITLIPRKIPSKRLPWKNAPENVQGLQGNTMSTENIIVLRKS
jgi:site-specific DNA-methyltransferase (cytosine-N4-specific)